MAERKVNGGDVVIRITEGVTDILLVCQVEHTFDRSRDAIDAGSKCGPDNLPGDTPTFEISGTAQILLGDTDEAVFNGKLSEAKMDEFFRGKTVFAWAMGPASGVPVPGDVTYSGNGFLTSLSTTYSNNEVATFDFTISVKGDYSQDIEPATT
ncbi:hypothetical protein [Chitinophaga sp. MM2321]|uniref:hypothetical protein n=1 Tax=Chitinophaga sp. MM2321 TaxID=3137178 RepID=UPI0032D5ACC7